MIQRRAFLTGLGSLFIAAPAIVRVASIMPVKAYDLGISMRSITEYLPGPDAVGSLDILFERLMVRPEWVLIETDHFSYQPGVTVAA